MSKITFYPNDFKICSKCGIKKPIDDFYKQPTTRDGFSRKCKKCSSSLVKTKDCYIYIVTHPLYPGWVKIGRSIQPEMRLRDYQTHDPTRAYKMYFKRETEKIYKIESFFTKNIESNGYEWFKISKVLAKSIIMTIIKSGNS